MKNKKIQVTIQVFFLFLFSILVFIGKPQIWMILFIASMILAFLYSRIYCGYICPINTLMKPMNWIKHKLKLKDRKIPALLEKPTTRILILTIFIALFIFSAVSGIKLPVLPAMVLFGAFLTLFFHEELWHRFLCPYGLFLSFPTKKAKHFVLIQSDLCINCTKCARVCPSKAVIKNDKHEIIKEDCLVCGECIRSCPTNAIQYK